MSTERLAQSETYYPGYQEAHSGVTAIAFGIRRVSDGQWYDFNDSSFKISGWVTKHQALAEDDDGLWTYDTGWAIPDSDAVYHLQWKITDTSGTYQALGPKIIVNSSLLDALSTGVQLSAQGKLDVNAECDTALADYDAPTDTEMIAAFTEIKGGTWSAGTDTLEHIRDKQTDIEADTDELQTNQGNWATATGFSTHNAADVRTEMDSNSTKLSAIETDTQDIQSRIPAALSSGNIKADVLAISGSTDAADHLEASAETIVVGAAATGTLSTTQMTTNLTEATNDHYNGRIIIWTSGVLKDQATDVTDYDGATKKLTYTATTEAPSDGDTFVLV